MTDSLETDVAVAASVGGFLRWRREHALPLGTPCYNCRTPLQGPWCYACGQLGADFHRSSRHLVWEFLESTFDADSRLWRTLPRLVMRPAGLTRDYLAGRRAPQVPPLRLFLVVLLLVFLAGQAVTAVKGSDFFKIKTDLGETAKINSLQVHVYKPWDDALTAWTRTRVARAVAHPDQLFNAMAAWAHDFAFLALPVSAAILSLMFAFRRGYVVFDHLVFSMHSLSFQGVLFVCGVGLHELVGSAPGLVFWLSPVHLFYHMRGVYSTSIFGTLVRMAVLFFVSSVAFAVLTLGLVVVGLEALQG